MTLGCGGYGGNITSDNISPRHLLNIKRLAYEVRPASTGRASATSPSSMNLPRVPVPPAPGGIDAAAVQQQVASYLAGGGVSSTSSAATATTPMDFVCEEDVRQAIRANRKIVIGERTIVTPAARDLADANRVFTIATWPRS